MAIVVLLIPGRVQGHYWRAFFRGRRFQAQQDWEKAINEYQQFLADTDRRPWIKRLLWLTWSIYTFDAKAMTLNNIGGCELGLGHYEKAEANFHRAAELDDRSPLPHYNLAILAELRGDREAAKRCLARAEQLGYTRTTVDQLIHAAEECLSEIEGSPSRGEGA